MTNRSEKSMKNAWTPEFTDFTLSPYTGLTRESWKAAAKYMLNGVFSHIASPADPVVMPRRENDVTYPHKGATGDRLIAEEKAEIFEGLTRSFFIASVMIHEDPDLTINGIKLADYYKDQIYRSTVLKNDRAYVGTYEELHAVNNPDDHTRCFQQTVETCALVIGLDACREEIWLRYTDEEKKNIADFLMSYALNATVPQNWRLFCMLDLAFLWKEGFEIDENVMGDHTQAILNYYAGDGWYRDGQCFDYYSCWAFNFYAPLWCRWYGYEKEPYAASQFEEHSNALMRTYADMFDNDGFTNMWGRSCIYRNAATSAFDGNMMFRSSTIDPGLARRICSGSLLQFLTRDDFLWNGIPNLGFYGQFTPLVQGYSCAESPFWLGKAFLCLALPKDHPFWTAKESENSFDILTEHAVKETALDGPGLCFSNHKDNGETVLRTAKVVKTKNDIHGMWNYCKLAYDTKFPWESTPTGSDIAMESQQYVLTDGASGQVSRMNAVFWSGHRGQVLYRRGFFDMVLETERHWTQGMYLCDFTVPLGLIRADKLCFFKRPATITLGSFGFPDNGTEIEKRAKDGAEAIVLKGSDHTGRKCMLAMTVFSGFSELTAIKSKGTSPDSENSIVIRATAKTGDRLYDASKPYWLISQTITKPGNDGFTDDELFPITEISYSDTSKTGAVGPVSISLRNGMHYIVDITEVEGILQL